MKGLSSVLSLTVAIAVPSCCFAVALSPQPLKADVWKDSLVQSKDKNMQMWLRKIQIGVELGTPYFCKGLTKVPDSYGIEAESDTQFEKELGMSIDQVPLPSGFNKGIPRILGMIYIFESMERNCPEVDRIQWFNKGWSSS